MARRTLGKVFEAPIDSDDKIARDVLKSFLGSKEIDFGKKVLDFMDNPHLQALA